MIAIVSDIMTTELYTIDAFDGLCKAERIMDEKGISCLPVMNQGKPAGILTSRDIRKAHPNRIVADAMSKCIISAAPDTSLWKAKQIFEENITEGLLVIDEERLVGLVTETRLYAELGKYFDILTGLYRSDYIYYTGMELLEKGIEVSVIFIDLDKFGKIDKEYGHIHGDTILKEVGMLLKCHVSDQTYLCRFGGDEFIVLTQYKLDKCKILAEILLKTISTHKFSNNIKVSASAGIAGGRRNEAREYDPFETITDLVNLASLTSTKAKTETAKIAIADGFRMTEAAFVSA